MALCHYAWLSPEENFKTFSTYTETSVDLSIQVWHSHLYQFRIVVTRNRKKRTAWDFTFFQLILEYVITGFNRPSGPLPISHCWRRPQLSAPRKCHPFLKIPPHYMQCRSIFWSTLPLCVLCVHVYTCGDTWSQSLSSGVFLNHFSTAFFEMFFRKTWRSATS